MIRRLALLAALALLPGGASAASPGRKGASERKAQGRGARKEARRPKALPTIRLQHLSTRETFYLRPNARGRLAGKAIRGLRRFLRCHHSGRQHAIAGRLADLLYRTARHFGDRAVHIVAGYRAPKVARAKGNPKSPHKRGRAVDFRIDGVAVTEVRDYVRRAFDKVGVGYYPNARFVHLDVGRARSAFWIDYSGPGEPARYSPDPDRDLRSGIADTPPPPGVEGALEEEGVPPMDRDPGVLEAGAAPPGAGVVELRGE